jgi:pSer/pThr/pTyr-binding forkhead associated (FHA) protein
MNRADIEIKTQVRTKSFIKFCPACKRGNGAYSITCIHCGQSLNINIAESGKNAKEDSTQYAIPDNGFAVYFQGNAESIATATDKQVVLGRKTEGEAKPIVDLTPLNGFALGVSRHHVIIRSNDKGYVIMDMNSSNGTWLDGKILTPAEIHDLPSGSTVQLGRLKLVVTYKSPNNKNN